jgi:predicted RNA-binding protein (virulence factor B family)
MSALGRFNDLTITAVTARGALLDGGEAGELLLPAPELPRGSGPGMTVKVFLYLDADDRVVPTTTAPAAQVREAAYLKIVTVNDAGAFLNWGLPKDLLLPWGEVKREQKRLIVAGRNILVCVFQAEDGRIAASARLDDFLEDEADGFKEGDRVSLLIADRTDLGLRVIVNHRYWGLVHNNEVFGTVPRGRRQDGYVKALRPDRKLNIALSAPGYAKVDAVAAKILKVLARHGGSMAVSDKTPPEEIYALFGVSKKVFKQTIGALYKNRTILMDEAGIHRASPHRPAAGP